MQCSQAGCTSRAVGHFISARDYRCVSEQHFCELHAGGFMARYYAVASERSGARSSGGERAVRYDIELVVIGDDRDRNWNAVYLRESGGVDRFFMTIGPVEGWTIGHNLKREATRRPLTHDALLTVMMALGGRLRHVVVDHLDDAAHCYHAKLHVEQGGRDVVVDVRPSDAFALAVKEDVPILISTLLRQDWTGATPL